MSYNVALFDFPIPSDFEKACDVFEQNEDDETVNISPLMLSFYHAISQIFPCICDLSDEEEEDGIWCDGPLRNNFEAKIPVIGFVYSKVDEALPIVIKIANEMGISVLDWQQERVFNTQ
ncbi:MULTISPECIES: hypothetical protein [Gammaproteobacteria]|uniref:hypothetical protein n=1 Tax=Gammaproteobacteria TaxID=1236 RepID=UPI001868F4A2|nr:MULTISPECIES: hypothetical protein [Gammaproteobacteria]